jgi:hypothetical protein
MGNRQLLALQQHRTHFSKWASFSSRLPSSLSDLSSADGLISRSGMNSDISG